MSQAGSAAAAAAVLALLPCGARAFAPSPAAGADAALRGAAASSVVDAPVAPARAAGGSLAAVAVAVGAAGAAVASAGRRRRVARRADGKTAFDPAVQVGALPPFGFWDPADLCKDIDEATFRKYRTAELKHARVAMMASLGFVMQTSLKFPGFESVPAGAKALQTPEGGIGFAILVLTSGIMELGIWREDDSKEPGDFGDPFGKALYGPLRYYDEDMRNRELNNGRLAMFTAIGILAAEYVSGKTAVEQFVA